MVEGKYSVRFSGVQMQPFFHPPLLSTLPDALVGPASIGTLCYSATVYLLFVTFSTISLPLYRAAAE